MFDARDDIIDLFEKEPFPYKANVLKKEVESKKESKKERSKKVFQIYWGWIKGY